MLSRNDSRRLAELERQLRHDDPEFCSLMSALAGPGRSPCPDSRAKRHRVSAPAVATASVIWFAALVLGVSGWWVPAVIAAVWAAVVVAMLAVSRR